jgi:hypothetical protein
MHGVSVLSKSEFYAQLNRQRFAFEDDLIRDYQGGRMTLRDLAKRYGIGVPKVNLVIERNGIERRRKSAAIAMAWANGNRRPRHCNKHGSKDIYGRLFCSWKANAHSRYYPFELDIEYLQGLLEKQNYKCAYTGIEMLCPKNWTELCSMRRNWRLISLDRIASDFGYVKGNVQFVVRFANIGVPCGRQFKGGHGRIRCPPLDGG